MRHRSQFHRHRRVDHASMAVLNRATDFIDRGFDRKQRRYALRNETIARACPLFEEPVVVCLHAGELQLGILDTTEVLATRPRYSWIQYRVGDSAGIHQLEPFLR